MSSRNLDATERLSLPFVTLLQILWVFTSFLDYNLERFPRAYRSKDLPTVAPQISKSQLCKSPKSSMASICPSILPLTYQKVPFLADSQLSTSSLACIYLVSHSSYKAQSWTSFFGRISRRAHQLLQNVLPCELWEGSSFFGSTASSSSPSSNWLRPIYGPHFDCTSPSAKDTTLLSLPPPKIYHIPYQFSIVATIISFYVDISSYALFPIWYCTSSTVTQQSRTSDHERVWGPWSSRACRCPPAFPPFNLLLTYPREALLCENI